MTVAVGGRTGKGLVEEELFARLVARVAKEYGWPREYAVRVMDQALAFLAACAGTAWPLAPSDAVDVGWHTFILYTREYADFCQRIAGGFIHHVPDDEAEGDDAPLSRVMNRTTSAIRAAGFAVDLELWFTSGVKCAKCSQCKNGCTDDPPPSASC